MFLRSAADKRPYHLGPFPLEALPRDDAVIAAEAARPAIAAPAPAPAPEGPLARSARTYLELMAPMLADDPAPELAPVPDDPERRVIDLKGYAYFMNASQAGICRIPGAAWYADAESQAHEYALVILVEHGRVPEAGNIARDLVAPALAEAADTRAAEIAVCAARHIRRMGFAARAHIAGHSLLDMDRLAVLAGLALRDGGHLENPYFDGGFSLALVSTDYALAIDRPLSSRASKSSVSWAATSTSVPPARTSCSRASSSSRGSSRSCPSTW